MHLDVVDDVARFDALESEWRALSTTAERPNLFLDWDWQRVWWQVYAGRDDRLHILTLREGGRLVGVLPLYRRVGPFGPAPVLRFIGTGEARHHEVGTEYADLLSCGLADGRTRRARVDTVLAHLSSFRGWRRVELRCLLDDALLLGGVRAGGVLHAEVSAGLRYRVRLDDGAEAHGRRMGTRRVRRIARAQRAVERDGGLHRHPGGPDDVDAAFSLLETLARVRRRERGQRSTFESARFRRFHRLLCRRWIEGGRARLTSYAIGDTDVASLYTFRHRDTLHYYQSGFTPANANRWMPLTVAHLAEMQAARDEGLHYYDLMRGEPPCYKDDFGCETQPMSTVHLFKSRRARTRFLLVRRARRRVVAWLARVNIRRT